MDYIEDISMTIDRQKPNDDAMSRQSHTGRTSTPTWLAASLLATGAISLAAAHAPPRIRLIGLFPIGFGLLVGWLLVRLASQFETFPSRRVLVTAAALLALGGWIGTTWETFRIDETLSVKSPQDELAARMMREFDQQTKGAGPEQSRPSTVASFRTYLSRRIRQLGDWPSPWPECFWLAESVAAAVAGGIIASRVYLVDVKDSTQAAEAA
jgi:hypothetical protein